MRLLRELKEKISRRASYDEQTSDYLHDALCNLHFLATVASESQREKTISRP
jgi:hypothetical protein